VPVTYQILIADDHPPLRDALKATLQSHCGWHVCAEATNGREAVEKAGEFKPDLIILDLSMPVMGGLEAAREILAASPHVPILLFTNHAVSAVALDAQKIGIRRVLNKTNKGDELTLAVESLLHEKSSCAAPAFPPEISARPLGITLNEQVRAALLNAGAPSQPVADHASAVNLMENEQTRNEPANLPGDRKLPK
jgi:DNA-binding NarL/FixJ family response regulator